MSVIIVARNVSTIDHTFIASIALNNSNVKNAANTPNNASMFYEF